MIKKLKKLVKVYAVDDEFPEEIFLVDGNYADYIDLCIKGDPETNKKTKIGDEYVVIFRKRRWYDRFKGKPWPTNKG